MEEQEQEAYFAYQCEQARHPIGAASDNQMDPPLTCACGYNRTVISKPFVRTVVQWDKAARNPTDIFYVKHA